jgi:hypothetical protein
MSTNEEDYVVVWEAPKLETPEFRLYYDDNGAVICYTGDKSMQGKYIVVDTQTFAEARPDIRVIDGRISRVKPNAVVYKLMPDNEEGVSCHHEDISIIVGEQDIHTKWKLNIYELQ